MTAHLRPFLARMRSEAGISLIEVVVALFVFTIIATGVGYTMLAVFTSTADTKARVEASNLAAQEIDLDRSIGNLFNLVDANKDVQVNGTGLVYHINRATQWVSDPAITQNCGAGGGILKYKSVKVTVSWTSASSTHSVTTNTVIDPGTRINDPTLGTILVSVTTASGTGSAGVTVTAVPSRVANGAQPITTTINPTDSQGCTYILQVTPGNYDITVSKTNFLDVNQAPSPVVTRGVVAGAAVSVGLQFDNSASFPLTWASNYLLGSLKLPTNLSTSFLSSNFPTYVTGTPVTPVRLYPFAAGYQVLAGKYVDPSLPSHGCASVDPSTWPAGTTVSGTSMQAGVRPAGVAAMPGGSALVPAAIPMGIVNVSGLNSSPYVVAVETSGAAATGDPGCAVASAYSPSSPTFTFGQITSSTATLGLPFGSWLFYTSSTNGGSTTLIPAARLSMASSGSVDPSGTVTFDPRQVAP